MLSFRYTKQTSNRIEAKKIHGVLEFNQSQWLKQYVDFNTKKRIEPEKMVTKMEKHCTN